MTPEAPPSRAEWLGLIERIEEAERLAAKDESLQALAELTAAEDEAAAMMARAVECGVRWAREAGKTWAEIAAATGVKDRQAAWRRWTDRVSARPFAVPVWQVIILAWLGLVILTGVSSLIAERRGQCPCFRDIRPGQAQEFRYSA